MTDNDANRRSGRTRAKADEGADAGGGVRMAHGDVRVVSDAVEYTDEHIRARYTHWDTLVTVRDDGGVDAAPSSATYQFVTRRRPAAKLGLMMVGWGGNNGTTLTAAMLAERRGLSWRSRAAEHREVHYFGSLTQCGVVRIGRERAAGGGGDVTAPLRALLPMVSPADIALGGWDICGDNLADATRKAGIVEPTLAAQLHDELAALVPLRGCYDARFIARNQGARATNVQPAALRPQQRLEQLRADIRAFRERECVQDVVVVWTANSERYCEELAALHDDADALLAAVRDAPSMEALEVSPSMLYALAAVLERCVAYVNGSPQNTLVGGVVALARRRGVFVCGDDFKSGQTKFKSVLLDFLVGAGHRVRTIVSYNHLGNNDMFQLTDEVMWRPKSAAKSRVVEDVVDANQVLYPRAASGDAAVAPDHVVVVKYVPYLGDSKRDVSEYVSESFLDIPYTTIVHNECLDSALCAPLILDLAILCELLSRVRVEADGGDGGGERAVEPQRFDAVLSALSYYMKLPRTPRGEPVVHALSRQRAALENLLKALVGLPPDSHLFLDTKLERSSP